MILVEEYYAAFGREVIDAINEELRREDDLGNLVRQLGMSSLPGLPNQHDAVRSFIYQFGVSTFLHAVQEHWDSNDVERFKFRKLMSFRSDSTERLFEALEDTDVSPLEDLPDARSVPSDVRFEPETHVQIGNAPPEAEATPEPPVVMSAPDPTDPCPVTKAVPFITVPGYHGPERRTGHDRRAGPIDRRVMIEVVFINRRFGPPERRLEVRRTEDRERLKAENRHSPAEEFFLARTKQAIAFHHREPEATEEDPQT